MRRTNIKELLKANEPEGVHELERLPFNYWRYNLNDNTLFSNGDKESIKAKAL